MAYFYLSSADDSVQPLLKAYRWNDLSNEFEEKCSTALTSEAGKTNNYHKYTMVNTGEAGIIWGQQGSGTHALYNCSSTD